MALPCLGLQELVEGIVSTIGTAVDVTAQELRLEAFFPSDDDTAARWRRIRSAAPK